MITAALLLVLLVFILLASGTGWSNVLSPARNELVFAERNRDYGAYTIRREHHRTMLIAFLIGLGAVGTAVILPKVLIDPGVVVAPLPPHVVDVPLDPFIVKPDVPKPPISTPPPPKPPSSSATAMGLPEAVDSIPKTLDTTTVRVPEPVVPVGPPGPPTPPGPLTTGVTPPIANPSPVYADIAPEYPGGMDAFYEDIGDLVRYPAIDVDAGRQGQVRLVFIVDEEGQVSDIQVAKSVSRTLDAEAVRVFKLLKRWKPGTFQGKPVRTRYSIVMNFKLKN